MKVGVLSVSLSVSNLENSKKFYEALGFTEFGGGADKNYFIMKNGDSLIGLFHGMFDGNIITFNPGWDANAQKLQQFDDVRDIQKHLKNEGVKLLSEAQGDHGPGSISLHDPDGNMILIDQHV